MLLLIVKAHDCTLNKTDKKITIQKQHVICGVMLNRLIKLLKTHGDGRIASKTKMFLMTQYLLFNTLLKLAHQKHLAAM